MKVGIIGGGISGLYLGYKLSEMGHSVCIFEQSGRLGGRVHTVTVDGDMFETGAGRFNANHKRLLKLLRDLQLSDNVAPIVSKRSYKINSRVYDYEKYVGGLLFKRIVLASTKYSVDELKSITLKDFMTKVLGAMITNRVIDAFGYNSEFELQNAYTSLKIFKTDFNDEIQYYYLQGGLSQIIETLKRRVYTRKENQIILNAVVNDYDMQSNKVSWTHKKQQYSKHFDKVVFCVTKQALLSIRSLMDQDPLLLKYLTTSIEMAPLHRIFVKFPVEKEGVAWFQGMSRVTTNLPIRYLIPSNPSTGLMQISYTDKQYADFWNSFESDEKVIDALMDNLKKLFPDLTIPRPLWIKRFYWSEGATYWKTNFKQYRNNHKNNYYIAGEITSMFHNAWMEGALESCDRLLKTFK